MASTKVMGALVLALATRPSISFLAPPNAGTVSVASQTTTCVGRHHRQHYCSDTQRNRVPHRTSTTALLADPGYSSSGGSSSQYGRAQRRVRNRAAGPLMMAKKKGGGGKKKKQATAGRSIGEAGQGGVAVADAPGSPSSTVASADAAPSTATAVASESPNPSEESPGAAAEAEVNTNTIADSDSNVIQNRVADAQPATATPKTPPLPASAGTGFGKPLAQPKAPPPKHTTKAAGNPGAGQSAGQQVGVGAGQGGGAKGGSAVAAGLPPKVVPGQDPAVPGLAATGSSDHQRVIAGTDSDGEVTEASFADELGKSEAFDSMEVTAPDGRKMTPVEMLKYLRDNNISIDFETMNPVVMKTKEDEKMAAMFPFPAANLVAEMSLGSRPLPSQLINAMLPLLPEDEPWDPVKIRPLPELKDFLLANRLHGGNRVMNVISSFMLSAMGKGDLENAKMMKGLGICVSKAENALTGSFRQAVMFAENRLAPFMGSTVCEEYSGDDSADAAATWIVLKACVAEWELRLREIRKEEVALHDIFRAIPNPTEGLDEARTASITGSVQAMGLAFSNNERILKSLPPEIRFMEGALGLNTTTDVRKFALQKFCPNEGMSPEELRLRIRSLLCSMDQLPRKSYHQLEVGMIDVYDCLVEGTPEEYNIYTDNWGQGENLSFDTYRVDTDERWRLRLRDIVTNTGYGSRKREEQTSYDALFKEVLPQQLWGIATMGSNDQSNSELEPDPFVMVKEGWLDSLDFLDEGMVKSKQKKKGMRKPTKEAVSEDGQDLAIDEEPDDIFSDFIARDEEKAKNLGLDDMELGEIDPDILDGPGPGMRELKLDYGFDLPEGMSLRGIKLDPQDRED